MVFSILPLAYHMQNINIVAFFICTQIHIADVLMLGCLIIETCMKLKRSKISEDIAQ